MRWIIPLSLLIIFEGIADILAKQWSVSGPIILGAGSLTAYLIANTFWLFALKNGSGLGRGAIVFSVLSAIIAILIGLVLYKESATTTQMTGIILGLISLVLIFWN